MTLLTGQLVQLIENKTISDDDLSVARFFLLDAAANIIAGQNSPAGRKLLSWAISIAPQGDLRQLDPARKAFLFGALCHILEVDDLHRASVVHPGCVVAPVIFALGHDVNGKRTLTAFLQGVEATTRLGMAVGEQHYKIWHNTATCGPFGSCVATAYLLNLDQQQTIHALGNSGSQAAGFWQFLDSGAETKHLHAGRAAEAGVVAAQLAAHGFTGAPDILEGERGFFKATCINPPIENLVSDIDAPWQMHQTSIKPWPSCRHTHPSIELGLNLHGTLGSDIDKISTIEIETYRAGVDLCDRPDPNSVYGAKFSLQHCFATALQKGIVDLSSFEEGSRLQIRKLAQKIKVRASDYYQRNYPVNWGSAVTINFNDGTKVVEKTLSAQGDPNAQITDQQLESKACKLIEYAGATNAETFVKSINDMTNGGCAPDILSMIKLTHKPA